MGHVHPFLVIICFSLIILAGECLNNPPKCPFTGLYHMGDGVADNGNAIRTIPSGPLLVAARLPYGKTYFGYATGRWSDGRLIVDFAGRVLGFREIKPYLDTKRRSANNDGVIFAVAGSPVLDGLFYATNGVKLPSYVAPLNQQLAWFRKYQQSGCSTPKDCKNKLANSLFFMGDVEGNDIRYPLLQGKSIQEIQNDYVPLVIETLINGTREVIRAGARRMIVPGNVPLGCYPSILSAFPHTNDTSSAYDDIGCLKSVNNLVVFKNNILQSAIGSLKLEFPNVTIIYADFYTVVDSVIRQAIVPGFDNNAVLKACCGTGGQYNYDKTRFCGTYAVPVCSNIKQHIHWDGIHLTDEANDKITNMIAPNLLPALGCM